MYHARRQERRKIQHDAQNSYVLTATQAAKSRTADRADMLRFVQELQRQLEESMKELL
ncbi:MAG: hypothetical protein HYX69_20280 [Planctomycetia bacterium]|nr:hypothetical protein [Planctomycetia bacterium]